MDCACHGEPMYWHSMPARKSGGLWRCAVRKRELQQARGYAASRDSYLRYWHKAGGGYVKRRQRQLAAQRQQILDQLDQLAQEATNVES